jgi:peptidoglycan/xylan/chitin deacetylase (PgdA/CDA1 family)
MTRGDVESESICPQCGSSSVVGVRVVEHEPCGAIKPTAEFRTGDGLCCPDCDVPVEDVTVVAHGPTGRCEDCGRTVGTRGEPPNGDASRRLEPAVVREDVRSRLTATSPAPGRPFQVAGVTVLIALLVVAAMLAPITPSLRGGGSEPGHEPAASPVETQPERAVSGAGTWTDYRSIVIFRNDDVQPNYRPETRRAVDRVFIEENVPVTQGVVPAIGDEGLPDGFCRSLREQARAHPDTFEYALHGYSHEERTDFHGGSEFGGLPAERQATLLREGTVALRTCLQRTPTTFIPPFDSYDDATATALADEGYAVVSGGTWFTEAYYDESGPFERNGIHHLPASRSFVRNWTTNEFYAQSRLEAAFDDAYRDGAVYVQTLHYPTFTTESSRDRLRGLIDHMQSRDGVAFMTIGEFAHKSEHGEIERTDDGWRVLEASGDEASRPRLRAVERGPRIAGRRGDANG